MTVVLDASALLALMNDEPSAITVRETLTEAVISAVNLAEVVSKLVDRGMPEAQIFSDLEELDLSDVPFDVQLMSNRRRPPVCLGLPPGLGACRWVTGRV